MSASDLTGRRIVVGITGGIAAYKACELVSTLVKAGAQVRVVMTQNALRFVGDTTLATLSGNCVYHNMWHERTEIDHIALTDFAEAIIVAPATANIIGKLAHGIADDLLSTTLLAFDCPVIIAPAMNTRMLNHEAVQANLALLRERGVHVLACAEGRLACGDVGAGRLPDTDVLVDALAAALEPVEQDLAGMRVLITAGPTREMIDPVRFLSNPSSGKMGYALATEARRRGATVTLVSGPVALEPPPGVEIVRVRSAEQMHEAVQAPAGEVDVFIGAAAVADWRPSEVGEQKLKKSGREEMQLRLVRTPDIIKTVGEWEPRPLVVGFAAETENVVVNAEDKRRRKGMDMIVANDVSAPGAGFETDTNRAMLIDVIGRETDLPLMSKAELAAEILSRVRELIESRESQ